MLKPLLYSLTAILLLTSCNKSVDTPRIEQQFSSPWSSEKIYISEVPPHWTVKQHRAPNLTLSKKEPLASLTLSKQLTLKIYDALYRSYEEHPPLGSLINTYLTQKDSYDPQSSYREGFTQGGFIGLMGRVYDPDSKKESIYWIFQTDSRHFHHLRDAPSKQAVNKTGSLFFELEGSREEIKENFKDIEHFIHQFRLITPLENY